MSKTIARPFTSAGCCYKWPCTTLAVGLKVGEKFPKFQPKTIDGPVSPPVGKENACRTCEGQKTSAVIRYINKSDSFIYICDH